MHLWAGTPQDIAHAEEWFTKSAEQGNQRAAYNLGCLYQRGGGGIQANKTRAAGWFLISAAWGYAPAQYLYAVCCLNGVADGGQDAALQWLRRAGEQGYAVAQLRAGLLCMGMESVTETASEEGQEWLLRAAKNGVARAMFEVAMRMLKGVPSGASNLSTGLEWLKRAAKAKWPAALCELGNAIIHGAYGLEQDEPEGADLLRSAAKAGNAEAQAIIGAMSIKGYIRKIKSDMKSSLARPGSFLQVCRPPAPQYTPKRYVVS